MSTNASSFIKLPEEIRSEIIEYVVLERRPTPRVPSLLSRWRATLHPPWRVDLSQNEDKRPLHFHLNTMQWSYLSLRKTCKQLQTETDNIVELLKKILISPGHLDIMFVENGDTWATWLTPMRGRTNLEDLRINMRLFSPNGSFHREITGIDSYEGRERLARAYHALLFRFLCHGPRFEEWLMGAHRERIFSANKVTVDLPLSISFFTSHNNGTGSSATLSYPDISNDTLLLQGPDCVGWSRSSAMALGVLLNEKLLDCLSTPQCIQANAQILFERLGKMASQIGDEQQSEINMSQELLLRRASPAPSTGAHLYTTPLTAAERVRAYRKWRARINETRKKLGFDGMEMFRNR